MAGGFAATVRASHRQPSEHHIVADDDVGRDSRETWTASLCERGRGRRTALKATRNHSGPAVVCRQFGRHRKEVSQIEIAPAGKGWNGCFNAFDTAAKRERCPIGDRGDLVASAIQDAPIAKAAGGGRTVAGVEKAMRISCCPLTMLPRRCAAQPSSGAPTGIGSRRRSDVGSR